MASTQPITTALLSLLPSYNPTTVPPRLITTASSLLTQSRQRASNLKPEEEIARAYACAEIAVNRLREPLRLPPKKTGGRATSTTRGGPPCKPTVYKKLLTFLEGVLERDAVTPQSRNKRKRDAVVTLQPEDEEEADASEDQQDEDTTSATPSKRARLSTNTATPTKSKTTPARTASTSTRKQSNGHNKTGFAGRISSSLAQPGSSNSTTSTEAPASIMPTIRKLCKHYATPSMAPHVYTGVCIVLRLAELWPPSSPSRTNNTTTADNSEIDLETTITALTVALYLMVLTKMQRGQLKTRTFNAVCAKAVELFGQAKGLDDQQMIAEWIRRVNREGWCKGQQWWDGVPEEVIDGVDGAGQEAGEGQTSTPTAEDDEGHEYGDDDNDNDNDNEDSNSHLDDLSVPGTSMRKNINTMIDDLSKPDPEDVLLPGLGTMMQDALDWNSEEKKRAFDVWKRGIVRRLQSQEGSSGVGLGSAKKRLPASGGRRSVAVH